MHDKKGQETKQTDLPAVDSENEIYPDDKGSEIHSVDMVELDRKIYSYILEYLTITLTEKKELQAEIAREETNPTVTVENEFVDKKESEESIIKEEPILKKTENTKECEDSNNEKKDIEEKATTDNNPNNAISSSDKELTFRCLECDHRALDKVGLVNHVKDCQKEIENENNISFMCI